MIRNVLPLALMTVAFAGAAHAPPAAPELARHQGTWTVDTYIFDGTDAAPAVKKSITRTVEGDHVVWKRDGKNFAGTGLVLDLSKEPKALDVIPDGGKSRGEHVLGIYTLDGDRLMICMAAPGKGRPERFSAEKGSGHTLMKFVRLAKLPKAVKQVQRL